MAAGVAQVSGTLVAFLGIFGWGLFASTIAPALAIGLNWDGATRAGAIASIGTGLGLTLVGGTLGYFKVITLPDRRGRRGALADLVAARVLRRLVAHARERRGRTRRGHPARDGDLTMRFADLQVGQTAERTKVITASLVDAFAELTGDFSPVHVDEAAAAKTQIRHAHRARAALGELPLRADRDGPSRVPARSGSRRRSGSSGR